MVIYVVQPGDSIWSISRKFGVSMESIMTVNGSQEIPGIVIGEALAIPARGGNYIVQPGDSIWSISQKFNVSVLSITSINMLSSPYSIYPGMVLKIPEKSKKYGFIEVNAYIEPSTSENETHIINEVGKYLTYLSPFSYRVTEDGSLIPINDENILTVAKRYRDAPMMVITNFKGGTFDTDLGHTILTSNVIQQSLIHNILNNMKSKGYYGLNIDFERISPDDRELYNDFLRKVVASLHPLNYPVATALAPKTSSGQIGAWYGAHDYQAHGQIVDFVILMTYEWGWSGGPPLPVAPINQVRAVLNYAVSVIPRKKIIMGMPLYGYDWIIPYLPHGSYAVRLSPQQAISLALKYGSVIRFDEQAQSPFINYTDERGVQHIIWFEDARSVQAKFLMANEFGLKGVSYWELGSSFPQNWYILDDMFQITKVIT